jgi:nucleoid-associated protein YgaU
MPNDAKLGLVVGVGLVIAVAVVFFRKEAPAGHPAAVGPSTPAMTPALPPGRADLARTAARALTAPAAEPRSHTVQEGETLFGLAQRYYGDAAKYSAIYQVNRNRLGSPDQLPPGTVLVIPELPEK